MAAVLYSLRGKFQWSGWQYLIDEAIWQHSPGDSWMLLDLEKTLIQLRKYVLVEDRYIKQVYDGRKKLPLLRGVQK